MEARKVTITWFEGALYVSPWVSLLEPELQFTLRKVNPASKEKVTYTEEKLYTPIEGGCMVSTGMYERITSLLTKYGFAWEYAGHLRPRAALMPEPVWSTDLTLRHRQEEALSKITTAEFGGIIECCTAYGKSFLLTEVCRMYPTLNIVIISARQSVVKMLHARLSEALSERVGLLATGAKAVDAQCRVIVSTCASAIKAPLATCDMVLFDEVHNLGGNQIAKLLLEGVHRARMFGLTATLHRGDGAIKMIEALFGKTIMKVVYQEAVDNKMVVPMYFRMMEVPGARPLVSCNYDVIDKRRHFWQNHARNDAIAKAARFYMPKGQILIMVETLEHAAHLHKHLPEFTVVHYGAKTERAYGYNPDDYKITPKIKKQMAADFAAGTLRWVISTKVWAEGIDLPKLAVVIRADGSVSPIAAMQIPGRGSRLHAGKTHCMLIDFKDDFSPWSKSKAEKRRTMYLHEKWKEV